MPLLAFSIGVFVGGLLGTIVVSMFFGSKIAHLERRLDYCHKEAARLRARLLLKVMGDKGV